MPSAWNAAISASVLPRMASRLRAGFERRFGGAQIGARLHEIGLRGLVVAQRHRLAFEQRAVLPFDDLGDRHARARPIDAGDAGQEIVLRLHHVGGFDEEQRLAGLDRVARLGHQPRHPPGIGRIDRRRMILVDGDLAFGGVLGPEHLGRHRLDAERRPLRRRRLEARGPLGLAGQFGVLIVGAPGRALLMGQQREGARGQCQQHDDEQRVRTAPGGLAQIHPQTAILPAV